MTAIRPCAATTPTFSLAWKGASTDGKRSFVVSGEVAPEVDQHRNAGMIPFQVVAQGRGA
jgi:hypothetical protein